MTSVNSDNRGKEGRLRNLVVVEAEQTTILIEGVYESRNNNSLNTSRLSRRRLFKESVEDKAVYLVKESVERGQRADPNYEPVIRYNVSDDKLPFSVEPHFEYQGERK
jgi:hypothetical protein